VLECIRPWNLSRKRSILCSGILFCLPSLTMLQYLGSTAGQVPHVEAARVCMTVALHCYRKRKEKVFEDGLHSLYTEIHCIDNAKSASSQRQSNFDSRPGEYSFPPIRTQSYPTNSCCSAPQRPSAPASQQASSSAQSVTLGSTYHRPQDCSCALASCEDLEHALH